MPVIFEPLSMLRVPPLLTSTSEAVLSFSPCKATLFPSVRLTPLPTVKSEPLELRLTVRSVVSPIRVMLTVFPL